MSTNGIRSKSSKILHKMAEFAILVPKCPFLAILGEELCEVLWPVI